MRLSLILLTMLVSGCESGSLDAFDDVTQENRDKFAAAAAAGQDELAVIHGSNLVTQIDCIVGDIDC